MGFAGPAQSSSQERQLKLMLMDFGQLAPYRDRLGNHRGHIVGDDELPYAAGN